MPTAAAGILAAAAGFRAAAGTRSASRHASAVCAVHSAGPVLTGGPGKTAASLHYKTAPAGNDPFYGSAALGAFFNDIIIYPLEFFKTAAAR